MQSFAWPRFRPHCGHSTRRRRSGLLSVAMRPITRNTRAATSSAFTPAWASIFRGPCLGCCEGLSSSGSRTCGKHIARERRSSAGSVSGNTGAHGRSLPTSSREGTLPASCRRAASPTPSISLRFPRDLGVTTSMFSPFTITISPSLTLTETVRSPERTSIRQVKPQTLRELSCTARKHAFRGRPNPASLSARSR